MYYFTSEAVTKGHPDKLCDQIADAILTECLAKDPKSHVACEVCATTGVVVLMGEITTTAILDYKDIARDIIKSIGYVDDEYGLNYKSCSIIDMIDKQSPEINNAVVNHDEMDQGAGDQGIMFGYACDETKDLMPLSIYLAHKLARQLEFVRENGATNLRPDGKTQVTLKYNDEGTIIGIDTILISTQHSPDFTTKMLDKFIKTKVIDPVITDLGLESLITKDTKYLINPSGSFTIGGPHGDTGLTGRKLAVDTYGGHAKFGGGAMCGKDPSKVDRSAAYMARYIAKNFVATGECDSAEVQLSYGIGIAEPISVNVKLTGTRCNYPASLLESIVREVFDLRPASIIKNLKLLEYNYNNLSGACQFGEPNSPWEDLDDITVITIKNHLTNYLKGYCGD